MVHFKQILTVLLLITFISTLTHNNHDPFTINTTHAHVLSFQVIHPTRVTFLLYHGSATFNMRTNQNTIETTSHALAQFELTDEHINKNITLEVSGGPAIGLIVRQTISQFNLLERAEEKFVHLKAQSTRVIELHPRKFTILMIQRFEGSASFTTNRCLVSQKTDCFYELERLEPNKMSRFFEEIRFDQCGNCIVLISIEAHSAQTRLRLSIDTPRLILSSMSSVALLKEGQKASFLTYGLPGTKGKIEIYSGGLALQSDIQVNQFKNGYTYQVPITHNYSAPLEITLEGKSELNYVLIEAPGKETLLQLRDGFPETFNAEPNKTYVACLDKKGRSRGNFVVSGSSSLLSNLNIRFFNKGLQQHYTVRPHFLFPVGIASQNFQLDNSTGSIELQIKTLGNQSGHLNISASVDEIMNLPLNWKHSNVLEHYQSHIYLVDGISGGVEIVVQKCVECHLEIGFGSEPDSIVLKNIKERIYKTRISSKEGYTFVKMTTNNYAFYSVIAQQQSSSISQIILSKPIVQTYLTDPDQLLELNFVPPSCGQHWCQNAKYYLVQGSDRHHVASRAYCPNSLFDFDQKTKDIVFQQIFPQKQSEGLMSYVRPLKHRDWLLIAVEVNQQILSYDIINSGEIREYNNMRWPTFFFALFLTFAVFISFVLFMSLRRPKGQSSGYLRGASAVSEQDFNE